MPHSPLSTRPAPRDSRLRRVARSNWFGPLAVALVSALLVMSRLDPAGDHPTWPAGPGLTVDEPFNIDQGVRLADRLLAGDLAGFRAVDARLPDHPPLGRIWIGLCHELAILIFPPVDARAPWSATCARIAPAIAFSATVFLIGWYAAKWYGRFAGLGAGASLLLMPRLFGHAHLASLESCIDLTYAATVLYLADRWGNPSATGAPGSRAEPASGRSAVLGGLLFGLALLTKIQAVLLPIPVLFGALLMQRRRALWLVPVWGAAGGLIFLAAWPWMWDAPWDRIMDYLGKTTERAVIYTWYGGQVVADRDVPWHYPWVHWLATMPLAAHLLGACGAWQSLVTATDRARGVLILACLLFPLIVFSIPGVAVYDGERLFSVSFPLWALLAGRGAAWLRSRLEVRMAPRYAIVIVSALLATQGYGHVRMAPAWLSYFNVLAGGAGGAERLGLPVCYWGDGLIRTLLDEVAVRVEDNAVVAVAPVLHDHQWPALLAQRTGFRDRNIRFAPLGSAEATESRYLLLFFRREYLPPEFRGAIDEQRILAAVRRDGATLAALYRLR
jgi:hypothetical protein